VVTPPPFRNDFLHPVDVIEEIMIGRGMASFAPVMPHEFTVGRLTRAELRARRVRDQMVGLGYQEMIYNYLGARTDFADRMLRDGSSLVEIANPMSESFAPSGFGTIDRRAGLVGRTAELRAETEGLQAFRSRLARDVRQAWYRWLRARQSLGILDATVELVQ
jgi:hypothetical protein